MSWRQVGGEWEGKVAGTDRQKGRGSSWQGRGLGGKGRRLRLGV